MCLAIPGQIESISSETRLATVNVMGVRREVNVDLLKQDPPGAEDWVLIHVGFAMMKISEEQAAEQMSMLSMLGEDDEAREEAEGYIFGSNDKSES
ncbi:MAG: HypC/HybG/HupF family hydrogenase formation chaperone [Phycisphaerales bacterium]|nr:HypC/HybG/HupF family hydrogenase formation chaperone [Phycisphaerales bacterium]